LLGISLKGKLIAVTGKSNGYKGGGGGGNSGSH
jgi:hypothetical protein